VSPPRLDGKKVGVFATRSPHRPNPIGMSLVKLERVEGSTIYFIGGDMVDETPVIDIKPYIPIYDNPQKAMSQPGTPTRNMREDPEGEEDDEEIAQSLQSKVKIENDVKEDAGENVKVPNWISDKKTLEVTFADSANLQIDELNINRKTIVEILQQDPRSVYVREKFSSQIYNFQVDGNNVICKFDDSRGSVNVLQVRKSMNMS
jgi:tRNA (adenine37-N6)-methyltransferase